MTDERVVVAEAATTEDSQESVRGGVVPRHTASRYSQLPFFALFARNGTAQLSRELLSHLLRRESAAAALHLLVRHSCTTILRRSLSRQHRHTIAALSPRGIGISLVAVVCRYVAVARR